MEVTFKGEPREIVLLIRSIKGAVSDCPPVDMLDLRTSPMVKHSVDTKAINELLQMTSSKRKEEKL